MRPRFKVLNFQSNPKDVGKPFQMGLDFWDCYGREKPFSGAMIYVPGPEVIKKFVGNNCWHFDIYEQEK